MLRTLSNNEKGDFCENNSWKKTVVTFFSKILLQDVNIDRILNTPSLSDYICENLHKKASNILHQHSVSKNKIYIIYKSCSNLYKNGLKVLCDMMHRSLKRVYFHKKYEQAINCVTFVDGSQHKNHSRK